MNSEILESHTQKSGTWQDFVGLFLKYNNHAKEFPNRILKNKKDFENGQNYGNDGILNASGSCQNDKKIIAIGQIISEQIVTKQASNKSKHPSK
jgi:hypothetical protein